MAADPKPPSFTTGTLSLLGPNQRKLVGFTVAFACLVLSACLLVFVIGVSIRLLGFFSSLLWPLAISGVLALMLRPVIGLMQDRLKLSPAGAVAIFYAVFALIAGTTLLLVIPILISQVHDFVVLAPRLAADAVAWFQQTLPRLIGFAEGIVGEELLEEHLQAGLTQAGDAIANALPGLLAAGERVLTVVGVLMGLTIVPVFLFFFLQSQREPTERLGEALPFFKPETRDDVVFLVREFVNIVVTFFRGQLLIALIVGILLALGFTLVGLRFSILIGLFLGLLNVIPYLGFIVGLLIALPLALLQPDGGLALAGFVALVFIVVQSFESWFLTPKIMGDRTGLHPVVILIAILFWGIALDGLLGMVLAIPLTAFFITAWRLARHKYIQPLL